MILLLNKCDLVPAWATKGWLRILSKEYPALAFHASANQSSGKCNFNADMQFIVFKMFWLFKPYSAMHDIGDWYVETFERDKKRRTVPSQRCWDGLDANEQLDKTLDIENARRRKKTVIGIVEAKMFRVLDDPLRLDIVISFPNYGFHLRFDPWSQACQLVWDVRVDGKLDKDVPEKNEREKAKGGQTISKGNSTAVETEEKLDKDVPEKKEREKLKGGPTPRIFSFLRNR
ncbi:unnamed protein product [Fraxinus pennsylvanica]|uniref:Uncharacterized protein n=1 Tax=Fraxinus pennsylvanica TaxID=56036 RepID=A0AAD2DJH6_9LAMI|nr:unnamed protein product [Fraxinus pennsylvanica]